MSAEKKYFIFIAVCCCLLVAPGVLCTGAGGATATVEITATVSLIAYNITATNINSSAETITWMTNGETNSTVYYGSTIGYGMSGNNSDWVISHTITLVDLSDAIIPYHYMVESYDSAGAYCTSPDFNFTTLVVGGKSLIVDSGGGGSVSTIGNLVGLPVVDLPMSPPALTVVSGSPIPMTPDNLVAEPVVIVSGDKSAALSIDESTRILDQNGQPLSSIDLTRIATTDVPAVPTGSMFVFTGYAYQIEPSGATFSPPITLTITTTPEEWELISGEELSIQYYNPSSGLWEALSTTTDPTTHSVTTMIAHASDYGLFIRPVSPASLPAATTTATTTISPPGPVQGAISGFNWLLIVQGLVLITAIVVVASIGLYFYRKQDGH
jgi:hypothetical protein